MAYRCLHYLAGAVGALFAVACADAPPPHDSPAPDGGPKADEGGMVAPQGTNPWVDVLNTHGSPSSVRVADLDADGYVDLVLLVGFEPSRAEALGTESLNAALVMWGGGRAPFSERTYLPLAGAESTDPGGCPSMRDTSTEVLQVEDWDEDGHLDVLFASGVAFGDGTRTLRFDGFPGSEDELGQPAVLATIDGERRLVRGRTDGRVDACAPGGTCSALPGQSGVVCPPDVLCEITDLAAGDFDHDGATDVVAGLTPLEAPFNTFARLWGTRTGFDQPEELSWPHPLDYEPGDLDGDGFADLVAQQNEAISDFPTATDAWLSDPDELREDCGERAGPFCRVQVLPNHDNHNDNASVADVDGDGCLDLTRIGVDTSEISVAYGTCDGTFATEDSERWPPGLPGTIGIQLLDVTGDGQPSWVVRTGRSLAFLRPMPLIERLCDPVRSPFTPLIESGTLTRLYARLELDGAIEPFLVDTGSALTFALLEPSGGDAFEPAAAEISFGCEQRSIPGRRDVVLGDSLHGDPVAGIVGADVFLEGPSVLDLISFDMARVTQATVDALRPSSTRVTFEDVLGHIIVKVEVGGRPRRLMLDTGADSTLLLGEEPQPGDQPLETTDGTGGTITLYVGTSEVAIGEEDAREVPVLRIESWPYFEETVRLLGGDIDGLLGLTALRDRRIGVDPAAGELLLSPPGPIRCR